jgi:hypothetical protein
MGFEQLVPTGFREENRPMDRHLKLIFTASAFAAAMAACSPAMALSMKECSTKYQAAKSAGTLNGMSWNDFRKAECSAEASETPAASTEKPEKSEKSETSEKGLSMKECSTKYQAAKAAGTLNGMSWNEFRKADCSAGAAAETMPAEAPKTETSEKGLSMKECSTKYQAAKAAGTLNGMSWNEFRKADCSAGAGAASMETGKTKSRGPMFSGRMIFPSGIDPKYAKESPGRARLHTCVDQYNANKAANNGGNGGHKWIEKGDGYWSDCDAYLKR